MGELPELNTSELLANCARLRRALAHVQCAVLDLHEAWIPVEQREQIANEANAAIAKARSA